MTSRKGIHMKKLQMLLVAVAAGCVATAQETHADRLARVSAVADGVVCSVTNVATWRPQSSGKLKSLMTLL